MQSLAAIADPTRRRIVELFLGASSAEPDPSAVQAAWTAALAPSSHWVVLPARSP